MGKYLATIAISLGLSACGLVHRSNSSGYDDYYGQKNTTVQDFYREKRSHEHNLAKEELGIPQHRSLSEGERAMLYQKLKLRRLERSLVSSKDKEQYYSMKPYMTSDRDKIRFLSIPSYEGRQRWALARGIMAKSKKYNSHTTKAIEDKDVILGMSKNAVVESWGEPDMVEVAGNPVYENERWHYKRLISSNDGFSKEDRIIYFEYGRVAGWERN